MTYNPFHKSLTYNNMKFVSTQKNRGELLELAQRSPQGVQVYFFFINFVALEQTIDHGGPDERWPDFDTFEGLVDGPTDRPYRFEHS